MLYNIHENVFRNVLLVDILLEGKRGISFFLSLWSITDSMVTVF